MKKLMSVILAATMALGLAVPALADGTTQTKEITLSYSVDESFTWSIPASIAMKKKTDEDDQVLVSETSFGISDAVIEPGRAVAFSLAGDAYDPDGSTITIKNGDSEVALYTSVNRVYGWEEFNLFHPTDGEAEAKLRLFGEAPDPHLAGTWSATVTFKMEIVEDNPTEGYYLNELVDNSGETKIDAD